MRSDKGFTDCFADERICKYTRINNITYGTESDFHQHSFYELGIIISGKGECCTESKSSVAKRGDVFVMPPGLNHKYCTESEIKVCCIHISRIFTDRFALELEAMCGYKLLFEIEPILRADYKSDLFLRLNFKELESLEFIFDYAEKKGDFKGKQVGLAENWTVLGIMEKLSDIMIKRFKYAEIEDEFFLRELVYIRNHCNEKHDFYAVAVKCGMNYRAFIRKFLKLFNKTPFEYLKYRRMEKAKFLLNLSSAKLEEIAKECGFYDISHFVRIFKSEAGLKPTEYRKRFKID